MLDIYYYKNMIHSIDVYIYTYRNGTLLQLHSHVCLHNIV